MVEILVNDIDKRINRANNLMELSTIQYDVDGMYDAGIISDGDYGKFCDRISSKWEEIIEKEAVAV